MANRKNPLAEMDLAFKTTENGIVYAVIEDAGIVDSLDGLDRVVAQAHLSNYGGVFVTKIGDAVGIADNEYEQDEIYADWTRRANGHKQRGMAEMAAQLEGLLRRYQEEDRDEADALASILEMGYTLDDFAYDDGRYRWAKTVGEEHGLL